MKVFFVCGPKRSGTHLVSSWLLAMAGGGEFINSPIYEGQDGFLKFDRLREQLFYVPATERDNLVISFEVPQWLGYSDLSQLRDCVHDRLDICQEIDLLWLYVMREPGNWLASRLKWSERQDLPLNKMLRFHEDEYLLNWGKFKSSRLQVAYDSFVAPDNLYSSVPDGQVYRRHLAKNCDIQFDEDTDKSIMSQLHGRPWANPPSSWDTEAIESKQMSVRDMPVTERWRNIVGLLKRTSETTRRIARQYWRAEWPDIIEDASNDQATSRPDKS